MIARIGVVTANLDTRVNLRKEASKYGPCVNQEVQARTDEDKVVLSFLFNLNFSM